jgi:hypothetical protein
MHQEIGKKEFSIITPWYTDQKLTFYIFEFFSNHF